MKEKSRGSFFLFKVFEIRYNTRRNFTGGGNGTKIYEYQAKEILKSCGVSVPRGRVAETPEEAGRIAKKIGTETIVVKAQIHAGGRGTTGPNTATPGF